MSILSSADVSFRTTVTLNMMTGQLSADWNADSSVKKPVLWGTGGGEADFEVSVGPEFLVEVQSYSLNFWPRLMLLASKATDDPGVNVAFQAVHSSGLVTSEGSLAERRLALPRRTESLADLASEACLRATTPGSMTSHVSACAADTLGVVSPGGLCQQALEGVEQIVQRGNVKIPSEFEIVETPNQPRPPTVKYELAKSLNEAKAAASETVATGGEGSGSMGAASSSGTSAGAGEAAAGASAAGATAAGATAAATGAAVGAGTTAAAAGGSGFMFGLAAVAAVGGVVVVARNAPRQQGTGNGGGRSLKRAGPGNRGHVQRDI